VQHARVVGVLAGIATCAAAPESEKEGISSGTCRGEEHSITTSGLGGKRNGYSMLGLLAASALAQGYVACALPVLLRSAADTVRTSIHGYESGGG
jgi:hypothetical protein